MKKIILLLIILIVKVTHAAESVSPRQAEDILKYRAPTIATDVVGKWKKVLHGPTETQLGQYNSNGIVEGAENKIMTLSIGGTDLAHWIPQESSTVYAAAVKDIMTPAMPDRKDIAESPRLSKIPLAAIRQEGDAIRFYVKTSYKYKSARIRTNYHRPISALLLEFSTDETVKEDAWLHIEIGYVCALQAESKDRLICQQNAVLGYQGYIGNDNHQKAVAYFVDFPKLIAFERVK